ncbi:MAG: hypothetical protein GY754_02015 [bacterium]|nr:hypothetical protein [bacterium]
MGKRQSIDDMHELAGNRNGKCLSKKYISANTKLKWQCEKGHTWEALPGNIKKGSWCPECAAKRVTITDMQEIAVSRGGKCLSKKYVDTRTKLKWQCREGHTWEALPGNIKTGSWCRECNKRNAGRKKLTIEQMQEKAKERGGSCLSKKYIDNRTKLKWKCEKGHIWETTPSKIKSGRWCPRCALEKVKVTIEEMHSIGESRGGKCLSKTIKNNETNLKWQCGEGHTWEATPGNIKRGTWCPECAIGSRRRKLSLTIEEMQKIAKAKGGKCLSKEYKNNKTSLTWQCKNGHTWEAPGKSIKKGSWCSACSNEKKRKK